MIEKSNPLSVRRQCELLGLNRSSLYYTPAQPDPVALSHKEELMRRIDFLHTTYPYMGSRKLAVMLQREGHAVSRKTVRRLMAEMGICAVYPRANLSKRNFKESIVPYLLKGFTAQFPNQVWSIDITYIPLKSGHMYLTAIIDWFSRKIVGSFLSDTLDTESVIITVQEAVKRYGIPAILNSDQGSQFTSDAYKSLLKELGIRQSMDGKRRWADNIMIERWFRSFKTEQIYTHEYESPRELRRLITEYIDMYNGIRPHEALDYKVPDELYHGCFAP